MHYRVLQNAIKSRPFVPFDIVMSSGDRYRVDHPENLFILKDNVVIPVFYKRSGSTDFVGDDIVRASYLHIAALEPVTPRKALKK